MTLYERLDVRCTHLISLVFDPIFYIAESVGVQISGQRYNFHHHTHTHMQCKYYMLFVQDMDTQH